MAAALGALGVAASATQLAAYALSIVAFIADARERMRNAPEQYREYEAQLKILINIASSVENVPALQTPEVKFHLETTATEVRTLQALICCRAPSPNTSFILRCSSWEAVQGSQQRRVSDHLERLHKKNTALLFYIVTINTVQLSTIMANTAPELEQEGYEIGENKEIEAAMPPGCELLDLDPDLAALVRKLDGRDRKTLAIVFQGLSNTGRQSPSPRRNRPSGIKKSTVNPGYSPGQQYRPYKHFYGEVNIRGSNAVTTGNMFENHSASSIPQTIEYANEGGHLYKKITIKSYETTGDGNRFHGGDTGAGGVSGGHTFEGFDIEGQNKIHLGNFETVELKRAEGFSHQ